LFRESSSSRETLISRGFSLIELAVTLTILAVLAGLLIPLGTTLMDSQRTSTTEDSLAKIYTAIVGNPKLNTYGYLGDVGDYPSNVLNLVQSPGLAGWNGPYLSDVTIDNGIVYDSFGAPVEYFQPSPGALPASPTDQLALISRGPDRSSTFYTSSPSTNPNIRLGTFLGTSPAGAYASQPDNADNVVYPHFTDSSKLLDYQSLGKLNINISNFDDNASVNALIPGCPNYYDVSITSIPRNTVEAYVTYNPGGASIDLLQGLYLVKIFVSGTTTPVWQEQVAINPDNTISRSVALSGVNSSLFSTFVLQILNTLANGNNLQFYQGATSLGTVNAGAAATNLSAANRCSRILVRNTSASVNQLVDSFIMPSGPAGMIRRYNSAATCSMTFANATYNTIAIYSDNLLIGTVGKRGNKRVKQFTVRVGDRLTFFDETQTARTGGLASPYTVACPASTATF